MYLTKFPIWANMPKSAMDDMWRDLHRNGESRGKTIRALKEVDVKAWVSIVRERTCCALDFGVWGNIIRMLALDCTEDEIRDQCPLTQSEEADAISAAKRFLHRAVNGELDIKDSERLKAAQIVIRLGTGVSEDTVINITTGVPREVQSNYRSITDGLRIEAANGGIAEAGKGGDGGAAPWG